jgi:hypothetical protein
MQIPINKLKLIKIIIITEKQYDDDESAWKWTDPMNWEWLLKDKVIKNPPTYRRKRETIGICGAIVIRDWVQHHRQFLLLRTFDSCSVSKTTNAENPKPSSYYFSNDDDI